MYNVDEEFENHDFPYDVLWLDIEHTNGKNIYMGQAKIPRTCCDADKSSLKRAQDVTIVDPHIASSNGYHVHDAAKRQDCTLC